jgi:hypothetical protein
MGISKQMQMEEAYRNDKAEERLSESIAREDDVGFKDHDFFIVHKKQWYKMELDDVVDDDPNKKINKEDK